MTEFERGAKVRRINTLMSACRLIPNREDILALWDARSYDELTDNEIVALQAYMEFAHRAKTTPASDAIRRLRSQVLAHLTKLGMYALPEDWTSGGYAGVCSICSMRRNCKHWCANCGPSETRSPPRPHGLRFR